MTTVVYVVGPTHCGSTVLGNLIGERPGTCPRASFGWRGGAGCSRMRAAAGASVVVDTSKVPAGAVLLERAPVELRVLTSSATAAACSRHIAGGDRSTATATAS